ncbi:MAG: hypothetical protein K8H99_04610 [Nitrospirae bacterium]|nr:hypothetical protein [Fimbriimonadaceae bacterium]
MTLPTDDKGLIGRECPKEDCEGYFKVKSGTGLTEPGLQCHCPYCGALASSDHFYTREQIEYARSVAFRQVADVFHQDLKSLEFETRPSGELGIGISLKVTRGTRPSISYYLEKQLETLVVCDSCSLEYAVYGVFGYCPDCGKHNSLQILHKNLILAAKMVDLAETSEDDVSRHLLENAIEDCVSAFDGFGRQLCELHVSRSTNPSKAAMSFQNVSRAATELKKLFGIELSCLITPSEWTALVIGFQKRHVIAHRMGVIDQDYIDKSGDSTAVVGRKVALEAGSIKELVRVLHALGSALADEFDKLRLAQ